MLDSGAIILVIVIAVLLIGIFVATRRAARTERARPSPAPRREPARAEVTPAREAPGEEPEPGEEVEAPPAEERKQALRAGLAKTRGGFIARIGALFAGRKTIDAETIDRLEEVLVTADIGVKTAQKMFEAVKKDLTREQLAEPDAIWSHIRAQSERILDVGAPPLDLDRARPFVILIVGVNGVGKTTTIGKLAAQYARLGKKVMMAAGDTFRAAATQQLEIWGERSGAPVVRGKEGGDPSSVIFDTVKRAQAEGYDVVIADTAGRLHTKTNLMEELQKVRRVLGKAMDTAPHETFLVVDSTTGQNAIAQAQMFKQAMDLTGIILTKLDGTAKGGVILGICDELAVPVRYIGIGEKVDDLREFDAQEFVSALYEREDGSAAA
jgi:fused signal recognition particle receptor